MVQAIFGWAVRALFGTPRESEKTLLAAAVGAAAVWPLLLIGVAFPKAAALVLAFVPIPEWVGDGWIRGLWIAAAIAVPVAVGAVLARSARDPSHAPRWKRWLHGFPVTAAIASAFFVAVVTAPVRRLIAIARRREDRTIPLLLEREDYAPAAEAVFRTLRGGGLPVERAEAPWLVTAPARVLRTMGGRFLRGRIPEDLRFYRGPNLDVAVNPNDITLQGEKSEAARAHALLSEQATLGPGLQTVDASAQKLEKRLKDIWIVYAREPRDHEGSAVLGGRLAALGRDLEDTYLTFQDWQILYREILQLERAIEGRPQVLAAEKDDKEATMREESPNDAARSWPPRPGRRVAALSTPELITGLAAEVRELMRKEIELAKTEARADLKAELKSARWLGVAAVAALGFVNMLFVALALALAGRLSPPLAALIVAGGLLVGTVVFALLGKGSLVAPLETTRKTLDENWTWAKNRIA
jgi:hypothetical protein